MKLDFEIAVNQQTKAHDETFEGVPLNHINVLKTVLWSALLVATSLMNTFHSKILIFAQLMGQNL